MKCIKCGKYPFCKKIMFSQQEICEEYIKRQLGIRVTREEEKKNENR